jgi:cell pole-organizing protein PopZ
MFFLKLKKSKCKDKTRKRDGGKVTAKSAEMSPSNFRHYAAGSKSMSQKQFSKEKQAFDRMADELKACTLTM